MRVTVALGMAAAVAIQLLDISRIIGVTCGKFSNVNLKMKTDESRQTFKGVMASAKVISLVCRF